MIRQKLRKVPSSRGVAVPSKPSLHPAQPFIWATALILALLLLGGDPNRVDLRRLLLAGMASMTIAVAVYHGAFGRFRRLPLVLATFVVMAVLLPVLQMIPLSRGVVSIFAGRETALATIDLVGGSSWLALSLSPMDTASVLISLLPPLAVFLIALTLRKDDFFWLFLVIIGMAMVSIVIGLFQFSTGGGLFNFFSSSHRQFLVGFFSNRNHQGLFLALSSALAIGWALTLVRSRKNAYILGILIGFFVLVVSVATNSRTGMLMCAVSMMVTLALFLRKSDLGRTLILSVSGFGAAAIALGVFLSSSRVADVSVKRFGDLSADGRFKIWQSSLDLINLYFPFGSGLGTFVDVFNSREALIDLAPSYINHAHNEYIELLIEAGAAGLVVVALFLLWYGLAAIRAVGRFSRPEGKLPLVAIFIIGLFLAHSVVDYPLRTAALAGVFALIVAFLARSLEEVPSGSRDSAAR
jgi:oligosaccharide repeat unit polymerase